MRRVQSNRQQAGGYTLIELLAVIAIIMLLIGLLLPAVQKFRAKGPQVQTKSEIGQIENAIESFKTTYDVKYLPSVWVLAYDYNPGAMPAPAANALRDARQYYSKVWPKGFVPGSPGFANVPANTNRIGMDGNQALVFFLGGISPPTGGPPNGFPASWQGNRTGFNNSPINPFNYNGTTTCNAVAGANSKGVFYDFNPKQMDASGHYHDPHWSPNDSNPAVAAGNIYYYFSAKEGNDYDYFGGYAPLFDVIFSTPGLIYASGGYGNVHPFRGTDNKYLNGGKYQIISAGADHVAGAAPFVWPSASNMQGQAGGDDQSNFTPGAVMSGR